MAAVIVVGLFQSTGEAEDAGGRLQTEGVPATELALIMLHQTGPVPEAMKPELGTLSLDPFVFGDVRKTFMHHITNGETAVCVRARTEREVEFALDTMKQYGPIAMEVMTPRDAAEALWDEHQRPPEGLLR